MMRRLKLRTPYAVILPPTFLRREMATVPSKHCWGTARGKTTEIYHPSTQAPGKIRSPLDDLDLK